MKQCPRCSRLESDDSLVYCIEDRSPLGPPFQGEVVPDTVELKYGSEATTERYFVPPPRRPGSGLLPNASVRAVVTGEPASSNELERKDYFDFRFALKNGSASTVREVCVEVEVPIAFASHMTTIADVGPSCPGRCETLCPHSGGVSRIRVAPGCQLDRFFERSFRVSL